MKKSPYFVAGMLQLIHVPNGKIENVTSKFIPTSVWNRAKTKNFTSGKTGDISFKIHRITESKDLEIYGFKVWVSAGTYTWCITSEPAKKSVHIRSYTGRNSVWKGTAPNIITGISDKAWAGFMEQSVLTANAPAFEKKSTSGYTEVPLKNLITNGNT